MLNGDTEPLPPVSKRAAQVMERPRVKRAGFVEQRLLLSPAAKHRIAALRWEEKIASFRAARNNLQSQVRQHKGVVVPILRQGRGQGADVALDIRVPQPCHLASQLPGNVGEARVWPYRLSKNLSLIGLTELTTTTLTRGWDRRL